MIATQQQQKEHYSYCCDPSQVSPSSSASSYSSSCSPIPVQTSTLNGCFQEYTCSRNDDPNEFDNTYNAKQSMMKYDLATWRMHDRIVAARMYRTQMRSYDVSSTQYHTPKRSLSPSDVHQGQEYAGRHGSSTSTTEHKREEYYEICHEDECEGVFDFDM